MSGNESLTTTEIKKQNCKKVFDYLYQNQRTSKQTIAQALGLSMPTVSQNLKLHVGAGVVRRDGFYESTGGQKAHVLRFVQGRPGGRGRGHSGGERAAVRRGPAGRGAAGGDPPPAL